MGEHQYPFGVLGVEREAAHGFFGYHDPRSVVNPVLKLWNVIPSFREDTTHVVAKGPDDALMAEVLQATCRSAPLKPDVVDYVFNKIEKDISGVEIGPISLAESWVTFNMDAGPGEPWRKKFPRKKDFQPEDILELFQLVEAIETAIIDGEDVAIDFAFKVHSKKDKYAEKKFINNRFRSIQGTDVVLQLLMSKWLHRLVDALYTCCSFFGVRIPKVDWQRMVTRRFAGKCTWGVDFTGFDKQVPANATVEIISRLCDLAGAPRRLSSFIAHAVAYGDLVMPSGEVVLRAGANPSGEYLTTALNTVFHAIMLVDACHTVDPTVSDVFKEYDFIGCGDDGLCGKEHIEVSTIEAIAHFIFEEYGFSTKLDLYCGEPYPAGYGCHAPYLGQVSVALEDHGLAVCVPLEPGRTIARGTQRPNDDTPQDWVNRVCGVYLALGGYALLRDAVRYPIPHPVEKFFGFVNELRKDLHYCDWSALPTLSVCADVFLGFVPECGGGFVVGENQQCYAQTTN